MALLARNSAVVKAIKQRHSEHRGGIVLLSCAMALKENLAHHRVYREGMACSAWRLSQ